MKCMQPFAMLAIVGMSSLAVWGAPPKTEQPAKKSGGDPAINSPDQRTAWKNADHMLASCVAIDNQEEVAIAKFAQKKLTDADAKEFAKMLIADHSAFLKKLQQHAPEATREGFLTEDKTPSRERTATDAKNPAAAPAVTRTAAKPNLNEQGEMPIDFLQLGRELAQQCLSNSEEMLNEKEGHEFDACFIGMQIAKHMAMKTKLEVYHRHASGELKDLIAQGLKTTTSHLEHAETLMKQIHDASAKTTSTK